MKNLLRAGTALAFLLATPLAFAQQDQHPQDQHAQGQHQTEQHAMPPQHQAPSHMAPMGDNHMAPMGNHMAPEQPDYSDNHMQSPAYGQDQHWHDGDHYNGSRHAVDWRSHHLRQPPHGYEWVQDGNNYVLIAITSGVIASIIANAMNQ